jgi:hypothetical protein
VIGTNKSPEDSKGFGVGYAINAETNLLMQVKGARANVCPRSFSVLNNGRPPISRAKRIVNAIVVLQSRLRIHTI